MNNQTVLENWGKIRLILKYQHSQNWWNWFFLLQFSRTSCSFMLRLGGKNDNNYWRHVCLKFWDIFLTNWWPKKSYFCVFIFFISLIIKIIRTYGRHWFSQQLEIVAPIQKSPKYLSTKKCTTCNYSCVMCHVSRVTWHVGSSFC